MPLEHLKAQCFHHVAELYFNQNEMIDWWRSEGETFRVSPQEYKENMNAILQQAAHKNIGVLIFRVVTKEQLKGNYRETRWIRLQKELSSQRNISLVDAKEVLTESSLSPNVLFLDPIHAIPDAMTLQAKAIVSLLQTKTGPKRDLFLVKKIEE